MTEGRRRHAVACAAAMALTACMGPPRPTPPSPVPPSSATASATVLELAFVDHYNLRQLDPDPDRLARHVAAIQANLDRGAGYGIASYVVFSRGFEDLLLYDFSVDPIGNIGAAAFPDQAARAVHAARYIDALRAIAAHAHRNGVHLVFHTNQLSFPDEVAAVLRPHLATASAPCVDGPLLWSVYQRKLAAFWRAAPFVDGLQLTADEADMSVTECVAPDGRPVDPDAILARLVAETAASTAGSSALDAKEIQVRAWGRLADLAGGEAFAAAVAGLPPGVAVSIKHTEGDFLPGAPPSHLLDHAGPRVILELDAWGEYAGWNAFPAYLGDVYAERIRRFAAGGGRRIAVRINWNSAASPIFEVPYGNVANVTVLAGLARDPAADPDDLLRAWIADTYPEPSRAAAFALYKASSGLIARLFSPGGIDLTDHGRVFRGRQSRDQRERIAGALAYAQSHGGLTTPAAFEARRRAIDAARDEAAGLVADLGDATPAAWRADMRRGLAGVWRVARLTTDQLELAYWHAERSAGRPVDAAAAGAAVRRIRAAAEAWPVEDAATFDRLNGAELVPSVAAFGFESL